AALDRVPTGADRMIYAATRTTLSPNIAQSGVKLNIIPDTAEVPIDIRTLPGDDGEAVHKMLRDAAGDLWRDVELVDEGHNPATSSPRDTPLWDALTKVTQGLIPGSTTVPFLIVGATDSRFFRRKGVVAYGYGLMSEKIPFGEFSKLFHGNNERRVGHVLERLVVRGRHDERVAVRHRRAVEERDRRVVAVDRVMLRAGYDRAEGAALTRRHGPPCLRVQAEAKLGS